LAAGVSSSVWRLITDVGNIGGLLVAVTSRRHSGAAVVVGGVGLAGLVVLVRFV
jgi:hypothetical protein